MRSFGRALGRVLFWLGIALAALWLFGPREELRLGSDFDPAVLPADLDSWLAGHEAAAGDILPGAEKRILWAGAPGARTPVAIVYLHGFTATAEELHPVPDMVAQALGANLFLTRLAGHGLDGAALDRARAGDWVDDLAEAVAIGGRLGGKVYLIATSTGGTLAALAANDPRLSERISGIVFVSPNFGAAHPAGRFLTWPLARHWLPLAAGPEVELQPLSARHDRYWTLRFPSTAVLQVTALAEAAARMDYTGTPTPALFLYSPEDRVVSTRRIEDIAGQWGGPVLIEPVALGEGDDPLRHVLAGDVLSPGQTARVAERIVEWIGSH